MLKNVKNFKRQTLNGKHRVQYSSYQTSVIAYSKLSVSLCRQLTNCLYCELIEYPLSGRLFI